MSHFVLAAFFEGRATDGGTYVHKLGTLRVLRLLQRADLQVVVICGSEDALQVVREHGLAGVLHRQTILGKLLARLSTSNLVRLFFSRSLGVRLSALDRLLTRLGVDLVFFADQDSRARQLHSHAYIFSVLDVCHLDNPEFPEVGRLGEFERRETMFQSVLRKAIAVITDSEYGRRHLSRYYGVPKERLHAAPFLISQDVLGWVEDAQRRGEVDAAYGLSAPYVFYPAQFWAHKNHRYIVAALYLMQKKFGSCPQAVFCGGDRGTLQPTLEYAERLGVRDKVIYCGFVPAADIPYLYTGALALVMPTYFGPTNIPPVEASCLGVKVIYSDLPSFREQMAGRATYVDLENPESLADAIATLQREPPPTDAHPNRAEDRLTGQDEEYARVLRRIVTRFRQKLIDPLVES